MPETKRPALLMLDELKKLRGSGVTQNALDLCAQTFRQLENEPVQEAMAALEKLAREKLVEYAALVQSLVEHVNAMVEPSDFKKVSLYFQRMALTSALLGAMVHASERLKPGSFDD